MDRHLYYNTYSLNQIDKLCQDNGYLLSSWKDFDIDIDISKPKSQDRMSTYTEKILQDEIEGKSFKRLQISGPLLMNWKNILIKKS